jgi:hypothetical protein
MLLKVALCSVMLAACNGGALRSATSMMKRLVAVPLIASSFAFPCLSLADTGDIRCIVTVANGVEVPKGDKAALYLTARQDVGIVKAQILNAKPPPILSSRIPVTSSTTFPKEIVLSATNDLTEEGAALLSAWQSGRTPLVISARLDVDGVAATRDSDDLVGKGTVKKVDGSWESADISLGGRGIGGKFVTGKKQ